jgi:hypothetical protein
MQLPQHGKHIVSPWKGLINAVGEVSTVYCQNHMKGTSALCGQSAECLNVKGRWYM